MNDCPLITCVCTTQSNRVNFVNRAIKCFDLQTYPNKNLLIVSQASEEENKKIEDMSKNRMDIKIHKLSPEIDLGTMRHISIEIANGDIICQWDDDDISNKDRVTNQYNSLVAKQENVASAYSDFLHFFQADQKVYWVDWSNQKILSTRFHQGTIMFYKDIYDDNVRYQPANKEEDWRFAEKLSLEGNIALVNTGPDFMYVYHGKNTTTQDHHRSSLRDKILANQNKILSNQEKIISTLSLLESKNKIEIIAEEGIVLNYDSFTNNIY